MAKISRVELMMVDLQPKVRRVDAIQSFVSQETPIVRITDADGAVGTGYSYTIGTGGPSAMELLKRTLAPALIGREALEIERIWRDLLFLTHATSVGAITSIALAAIDTALWDLKARKLGLPLHLLAGGAQPSVRLYTTEGGWLHLEQQALIEDALRARAEGFGGAKLKVGRPVREDVARIAAVRDAVGDGFEIFTDANQAFAVDEAIRRVRHYEPLDIGWLEEPLPADDIEGHRRLSDHKSLPIAVGDSLYSAAHFREYLERHACSVVQVDVGVQVVGDAVLLQPAQDVLLGICQVAVVAGQRRGRIRPLHVDPAAASLAETVVDVVAVQRRAAPCVVSLPGIGRRQYRHAGRRAEPAFLDDERNIECGPAAVGNTRRVHPAAPIRADVQGECGIPGGAALVSIGGVMLRLAFDLAEVQHRLLARAVTDDGQREPPAWRVDE